MNGRGARCEGSLVVDVNGNQLDGYWIDKDGVLDDHFQIRKQANDAIPTLSDSWTAGAAFAVLMVGLLALGRARR